MSGATRDRVDRLGEPRHAAMEPARDERGDIAPPSDLAEVSAPQWSPLAMSGATRLGTLNATPRSDAAMEPARDERGDPKQIVEFPTNVEAAMEPARDERGDLAHGRRGIQVWRGRNGARSR